MHQEGKCDEDRWVFTENLALNSDTGEVHRRCRDRSAKSNVGGLIGEIREDPCPCPWGLEQEWSELQGETPEQCHQRHLAAANRAVTMLRSKGIDAYDISDRNFKGRLPGNGRSPARPP